MQYYKDKSGQVLLTLIPGEKIMESVLKASEELGIVSAQVNGIGAVREPEIGAANIGKGYNTTVLPGVWELINVTGNVSKLNGKLHSHLHVALGGEDFVIRGGHLMEAEIAVTAEIFLTPLEREIKRVDSPYVTGIKMWDLG